MPFYFDFESQELPEGFNDDDSWPEPAIQDYQYLPPEDIGGAAEPVVFNEPEQLVTRDEVVDHVKRKPAMSFWERLLWRVVGGKQSRDFSERLQNQQTDWLLRQLNLFCLILPPLRELGATHIHCGYDGGNDEGFAWFRSVETADGVLKKETVVEKLANDQLVKRLIEAGIVRQVEEYPRTSQQFIEDTLESAAEEWGTLLLGSGFGTGSYQMYGAFIVDLTRRTITDNPEAEVPTDGNMMFPLGDQHDEVD